MDFPLKSAKAARPARDGTAWWLEVDGHVLLVRRPPRGLLGGMRALPAVLGGATPAPADIEWRLLQQTVAHGFTHFDLTLRIQTASLDERPPLDGEWWAIDQLASAGLPTLFAKCVAAVLAERIAPALPLG